MNSLHLRKLIRQALEEDLGFGDLTSGFFPNNKSSSGIFSTKADGILAGLEVINLAYHELDPRVEVDLLKNDGDPVKRGDEIARAKGPTAALLSGERVILNLLQHMSGIATRTKQAVNALEDSPTRVCDTRKTLPGLRMLQKYAVRCGGGFNHRFRLDDGIMIKDNHIKAAGGITQAVQKLRAQTGHMTPIEIETETRKQVLEAVDAGADIIMFDNRSPKEIKEFVQLVPDHIITEISGGITLQNMAKYRDVGADYISMGSLTHSVTALDISFTLLT
ncbi:MAG: carboxylating nicotinate-nucleotide diphosphorylase [Balneolaceae bacterium]|nr:carboxylating nicotinate-nucleotide diphosphorylase [Balneolaceae bacterium]